MLPSLQTIFGQERAIDALSRAYRADHLPHGLIFAGPAGVGKATTAAALGALFLCEQPRDVQACGACESCRGFAANTHPDYHIITKELIRYHDKTGKSKGVNLSIDVIRPELLDPAGRKSVMGRGKVFIIEQAELMSAGAQNSMLKTLEEPAGRTLIVLLTDQPGVLLPTIRSRCQTITFTALDRDVVRSELQKRGIDPKHAAIAADLAEGSLGVAIKWLHEGVVDLAGDLVAQLDALLKGRGGEDLHNWFKKAADAYAEKQLEQDELASKDQATREGLSLYLRIASNHLRAELPTTQDADALEHRCAAIDAIVRAESHLDANVNIPLVFQQLTVTLELLFASQRA
jgi:DNA polymerase III subunit delta'